MYVNRNNKKCFLKNIEELNEKTIYKIDVQKTSNLLHELFRARDKNSLSKLKFLDMLRYATSRKPIEDIFFDKNREKLLPFDKIKNIPPYSQKTFKAIYKQLKELPNLFVEKNSKKVLNEKIFNDFVETLYKSKQKNPLVRKRGKKRHKYSLPITGSPKFRVKRGDIWQVYGNKDIASKNYIIDGEIKPISYFSKNVVPLKVADLIDCLLVDKNTPTVYDVEINISEVNKYLNALKYIVTEKARCMVIASFKKRAFEIDFDKLEVFDGKKDNEFKKFIKLYIDNKELLLSDYIGAIRDGLNGKAAVLYLGKEEIVLEYKAAINKAKKVNFKKFKMKHLIVSNYGLFLGLKSARVVIKKDGQTLKEVALNRVKSIHILSNGILLSSDLINACGVRGIKIFFNTFNSFVALHTLYEHKSVAIR